MKAIFTDNFLMIVKQLNSFGARTGTKLKLVIPHPLVQRKDIAVLLSKTTELCA